MSTNPNPDIDCAYRAWELYTAGDVSSAKQLLVKGIERFPSSPDLHFTLAKIFGREEKEAYRAGARDQTPDQAQHIVNAWRMGHNLAFYHMERAHQLAPDDDAYRTSYSINLACVGLALQNCGELDSAYEIYERSQEIAPNWNGELNDSEWNTAEIVLALLKQADAYTGNSDPERIRRGKMYRERALRAKRQGRPVDAESTELANELNNLCMSLADKLDPDGVLDTPSAASQKVSKSDVLSQSRSNVRQDRGTKTSKSGCFVATAAYGSPLAHEVLRLCRFRDEVLLKSKPGRCFVAAYYRISPPLASVIGRFSLLRSATRTLFLRPVLWFVRATKYNSPET